MARPVLRTTARGKQGPVGPQGETGPQGAQGPQGERGLPGVNAVPADEAVAAYIDANDSATRDALTAAYGKAQRLAGVPTAQGAVVLSFDDGYPCWYNDFLPAFAERGQRATFTVNTAGIRDDGTRITEDEIRALHAAGHEISCHTVTHPSDITTLTPAQRAVEYDDSKAALEAIIGAEVTNFCYPRGARSHLTDRECLYRFETVWQSSGGRAVIDRQQAYGAYSLRRQQWRQTTHESILQDVRLAASQPVFVPIYMHAIKEEGVAGGIAPGTEPTEAMFYELIDLAYSLGVPLLTTREAFAGALTLANPDFRTGDIKGWTSAVNESIDSYEVIPDTGLAVPDGILGGNVLKIVTADSTRQASIVQEVTVTPGRTYTLSVLARTVLLGDDVGGVRLRARPYSWDDKLAPIGPYTQATLPGAPKPDSGWQVTTMDYTAPLDATRARVEVGIFSRQAELYVKRLHWGPKEFGAFA